MKKLKISLIVFGVIVSIWVLTGCVRKRDGQREGQIRGRSIEQVFDSHRDSLLSIPGVVGAGIANLDDKPSIMVMVKTKTVELESQIPKELDSYSVIIEEIGPVKTLDK